MNMKVVLLLVSLLCVSCVANAHDYGRGYSPAYRGSPTHYNHYGYSHYGSHYNYAPPRYYAPPPRVYGYNPYGSYGNCYYNVAPRRYLIIELPR
jgi:hypothetical protein